MKIVQFKNGKYGVRRRDMLEFWLDFEFLSRGGWWGKITAPSVDHNYAFDSIDEARSIIKKSKEERERYNKIWLDKGRKIKL